MKMFTCDEVVGGVAIRRTAPHPFVSAAGGGRRVLQAVLTATSRR